jgi:glycerate kinase
MRIIVAPDSYKGSVSALGVAEAIERGIHAVFPEAEVLKVPIADGGEGTVEALVGATGGRLLRLTVSDPLGRPVEATWGILGDGVTAVIEMAAASGLTLLAAEERNPLLTTSFGTGQLLKAALDLGLRHLIVGIGGSASNDGGCGMAQALGARFLDRQGRELPPGGGALGRLDRIDLARLDPRLAETSILVACDVDNPLCGARGASAVYGPQKGATPAMVAELDAALAIFGAAAARATGLEVAGRPGAGAAGGLGAGLLCFTGARLRPGVEIVLEANGFKGKLRGVDLVITGEGRTDAQTAMGKAPVGVARAAAPFHLPVVCLSGSLGPGCDRVLEHGISALMSVTPGPMALEACMAGAEQLVEDAAARLCRLLLVGRTLAGRAVP